MSLKLDQHRYHNNCVTTYTDCNNSIK